MSKALRGGVEVSRLAIVLKDNAKAHAPEGFLVDAPAAKLAGISYR